MNDHGNMELFGSDHNRHSDKATFGKYKDVYKRQVLIVGVCFAYHNIATIRAEKEAKIAAENSGSGSWKDGTYEGSGQGFGGQIVVSVTIKNGSIDDIQIKEAKNADSAYFDNAKKIIDTMKQKQTADVDVASGATYS